MIGNDSYFLRVDTELVFISYIGEFCCGFKLLKMKLMQRKKGSICHI